MAEFQTVALIGKPNHQGATETFNALCKLLIARGVNVIAEQSIAEHVTCSKVRSAELVELGEAADLALVVGGDGFMLGAARILSRFDIAVLGVNRGNLGFLTDLAPDAFESPLNEVLDGSYATEKRFLLKAEVFRHNELKASNSAMNEAVLNGGKIAQMIDYEVFIDDVFAFQQRSDGLIVSTPTGSTAYSLSGGGSIIMPELNAISLMPMFPHTLSARPIIVGGDNRIKLRVSPANAASLQVCCDGHVTLAIQPGDEIILRKSRHLLRMVHPKSYNYFNVLRSKLGWGQKLF